MKKKCYECGFEEDDKEYEFVDETNMKDGYSITLCKNCYDAIKKNIKDFYRLKINKRGNKNER